MEGNTILIVDDNANIVDSFKRSTYKEPFSVLTARTGFEALNLLKNEHVDLLITDEMMPVMRGTQLVVKVREMFPEVMAIILSGNIDPEHFIEALNRGDVLKVLKKPTTIEHILYHVHKALELKEAFITYRKACDAIYVE